MGTAVSLTFGQSGYACEACAMRVSIAVTSATNSSPKPGRCSSYQIAAERNSARASGWSSTRTPLLEFLHDLRSRRLPVDRLDFALCELAGAAFQLDSPCDGDLLLRLFQTGKQSLGDAGAFVAGQPQHLCEQILG